MTKLQFRVLYRQFLFRMVDLEVLSASAQGDSNRLLGQCAALLVFLGWVQSLGALLLNPARMTRYQLLIALWGKEHALIAETMVVVGLFTILSWDSMFPDRRDAMVLTPLPVRPRTVFFSKFAALAVALSLTVATLNAFSGITWPFRFMPDTAGLIGGLRSLAAYWLTVFAAGSFVFGGVLTVQGLAAQLPRPLFLRLSSFLQMAAFALFLAVYLLEPPLTTPRALADPHNQHLLAWLPSYWFFGLFHALNGSMRPVMAPLARQALIGLAIVTIGAATAFLLAYFRTLKRIVEQPDILPGQRGLRWLPRFGNTLETAIVQFSIRSLLRSRQHRVILAFYLGIGFAVVAIGWQNPGPRQQFFMGEMIASGLALCCFVLGTRVVMAMPLDLRANWVFRVTAEFPAPACLGASRRSLFVLAVLPPCVASAILLPVIGPPRLALAHVLVLFLAGIVLVDACLYGFHKIPFTCSYLPGKLHLHMAFFVGFGILLLVVWLVQCELQSLASLGPYALMIATLAAAAGAAWWITAASVEDEDVAVQFEDSLTPAVQVLGLTRDGVTVLP